MKMKGVHCQVSPIITIIRADQASVAQDHSLMPKVREKRREGPLLHVGEHAEGVGDADGRHHQRHEEEHAEEVAAADGLGAEQREAEAEERTARLTPTAT